MTVELVSKLHQLRRNNRDWLLTLLTAVLTLMIFVFAPLQAAGIFLFQTFAIAGLLVIIGGALIISGNPIALGLMSIAFIANFVVFFFRLFYPWPYNLHLLAAACSCRCGKEFRAAADWRAVRLRPGTRG